MFDRFRVKIRGISEWYLTLSLQLSAFTQQKIVNMYFDQLSSFTSTVCNSVVCEVMSSNG